MKKSRTHRKGRASGSGSRRNHNAGSSKSRKGTGGAPPSQRNPSSTGSHHSRRSQLVDLVVEDVEAEEEDRAQVQRERGSALAEGEQRHFS